MNIYIGRSIRTLNASFGAMIVIVFVALLSMLFCLYITTAHSNHRVLARILVQVNEATS